MLRFLEEGWIRIGRYCEAKRRALWLRYSKEGLELCAGREGDDAYVKIQFSNPDYEGLLNVLSYAVWAAELKEGPLKEIDTAPKGIKILAYDSKSKEFFIVKWQTKEKGIEGWRDTGSVMRNPTHWRPDAFEINEGLKD